MYNLVKFLVPFLEKYSFGISLFLFIFWLFQSKTKTYLKYLEKKAKDDYSIKSSETHWYNTQNHHHQIELKSSWLDLYKNYYKRTNNTLLLSFVFAYLSFNTSSYFEASNDNFFKLLTISTTLFLAGITYIQQRNREGI